MNTSVAPDTEPAPEIWTRGPNNQIRLRASVEIRSGMHFFPPLPQQSPLAPKYRTVELSPISTLYSYTIIHPSPKTGKQPFGLVYADFPEKVRVFGKLELVDGQHPKIGSSLRVDLESTPEGALNYVFALSN